MRARFPILFALLISAAVALPGRSSAQDATHERVQIALDLTDRRIEQAESLVTGSDHAQAQAELDAAISIQADARRAFGSNQLVVALRLTLEARGHADRAIAILRGPNPDGVLAQLERTREVLDRARERVEDCDQERARAMVRAALEMQRRAEGAAKDGRYLAALQLTMSARERAMRALRLCRAEESLEQSAERALRRTDELLSRAADVVADRGGEPARQALQRARDLEERAWTEYRATRFESSLRLTQSARAFAHRAVRLSGGRM